MNIQRKESESKLKYILRIINAKDSGAIDLDYTELFKLMFDAELSSCEARKRFYGLKMLLPYIEEESLDNIDSNEFIEEIEMLKLEIKKEKMKLFDQRRGLNNKLRPEARFEELCFIAEQSILNSNLPRLEYKPNNIEVNDQTMVVCFSDWHYGSVHSNFKGEYNPEIFVKRYNQYISEIINIGKLHNVSNLIVLGLGDLVSGIIHMSIRITNNEDIIEQTQKCAEYISDGLYVLSQHFANIEYSQVIGNHGRVDSNKDNSLYVENFERFMPWYIETRLKDVKNVTINRENLDEGIVYVKKFGLKVIGVHGDKDRMGSAVQNLTLMIGEIPDTVYCGHLHHFECDTIHEIPLVMSGCLTGTDDHSKNIRKSSTPSQSVVVYNKNRIRCIYPVELN